MLKEINRENMDCYSNLSQNYEAEFSPLTGKTPDRNGLYEITAIDDKHIGYLFYDKEIPIGFVVVDIGRERFDIAEFYVIPTHRKNGTGKIMAFWVFDLYRGHWQVRQISGADLAHKFWVNVISEYTSGNFKNGIEDDAEWGKVRVQKFCSK